MASFGAQAGDQMKEATIYVGNLDERITSKLVWELFLQVGRVRKVYMPKDRISMNHQGYGFVEFETEVDADYASKIMNNIKMYGKPIRVNKAAADKQRTVEIGAELFIGNLDSMVDEKALFDTFQRFGSLVAPPKIARSEEGQSKGYGFVSYADFDASDSAKANMDGQYMMNKPVSVQYAYKKDGKGERHGDPAERELAREAKLHGVQPVVDPIMQQLYASGGAAYGGAPAAMGNGGAGMLGAGMSGMPGMPAMAGVPGANVPGPAGGFPGFMPPGGFSGPPPNRGPGMATSLPTGANALPTRPPPSQGGFNYMPPGVMPPHMGPPPSFSGAPGTPAPGQGPPGQGPPGVAPPGFQTR